MNRSVLVVLLALTGCGVSVAPQDNAEPVAMPQLDLQAHAAWQPTDAYDYAQSDTPYAVFQNRDEAAKVLAVELADDYFHSRTKLGVDDYEILRVKIDQLDMAHVHIRQLHHGVPVFGGEAIVHFDVTGLPWRLTDNLVRDIDVDSVPMVGETQAVDTAVLHTVGWEHLTQEPVSELVVLRREGVDHLVWRVQLERLDGSHDTSRPVVFVDAHTQQVVWTYDNLQTATGTSDYDGTVTFNDYTSGSTRYLEDTTRNIGTYTWAGTTSSLYYVTNTTSSWTASADQQGVSAHWAAARTYDYYDTEHSRSGIDGSDGPGWISSLAGAGSTQSITVNYSSNYVNAFWNGTGIYIGDGDGSTSDPLTALDIVAHEMTHGVIESEADLTYADESGALNESFADVFGAMVEYSVDGASSNEWKIGEDAWTPGTSGDALRYMDDPTADGSSYDHYSTRYTGTADNGGVHWNSGIGNLAFYLASEGGTHPDSSLSVGTVTGIGEDDAGAVWYLALTSYMTSSSDFADARQATIDAATALFGSTSTKVESIEDAWTEVGVGSSGGGGGGGGSFCTGYSTNTSGTLSSGGSAAEPNGTYYYSSSSGTHEGCMEGPSSADFDLYFYKWQTWRWVQKASSTSSSSEETISSSQSSGYYYFLVDAYSGSGDYDFGTTHP